MESRAISTRPIRTRRLFTSRSAEGTKFSGGAAGNEEIAGSPGQVRPGEGIIRGFGEVVAGDERWTSRHCNVRAREISSTECNRQRNSLRQNPC
jgi:hypothetical protein